MKSLIEKLWAAIEEFDLAQENCQTESADAAAYGCVETVRTLLEEHEESSDVHINFNNPIAQLQERAQKKGLVMPDYAFVQAGESHIPRFTCTCVAEGVARTATGRNKQKAKRMAALAVLKFLYGVTDGKETQEEAAAS